MTTRQFAIVRAALEFLQSLDGGQATEITILFNLREHPRLFPPPSSAELEAALAECDAGGWITGIKGRYTGVMKWNLNDDGAAALLEMTQ